MTWLHLYKGLVLVLDNLSLQGTVPARDGSALTGPQLLTTYPVVLGMRCARF